MMLIELSITLLFFIVWHYSIDKDTVFEHKNLAKV